MTTDNSRFLATYAFLWNKGVSHHCLSEELQGLNPCYEGEGAGKDLRILHSPVPKWEGKDLEIRVNCAFPSAGKHEAHKAISSCNGKCINMGTYEKNPSFTVRMIFFKDR